MQMAITKSVEANMKEKEIIQTCIRLKTLKPLLQALRFGAIKFSTVPRSATNWFAMVSKDSGIFFEHDIYFYTSVEGINFYSDVFANDEKGMKTRIEQEMQRINDGLRDIK